MKIMLVIRWPVGGIRTYLDYVFQQNVLHGHTYVIVAPDLGIREYLVQVFSGVSYTFIASENNTIDLCRKVKNTMAVEQPDIVHSHGTTAGIVVSLMLMTKVTPHMVTMHDVFFDSQYTGVAGLVKKKFIGYLLNKATIINPCGFDASENFKAFFSDIDSRKIKPIRNGIDCDRFSVSVVRDLKAEAGVGKGIILMGFFGRFMSQKGFDLLILSLEKAKSNKTLENIHVACFGWGGFIREEQEAIRKKGLEHVFTFFQETNDMPAALRGVDIAVMPSRWEACPLLPMEALAVGTPIIASNCVGMREVCESSPAVIFQTGSVEGLYSAINRLVNDFPHVKSQSSEYCKVAINKFSSVHTAVDLNTLYMSLNAN